MAERAGNSVCKICGEEEWKHHVFAQVVMPGRCVCDPGEWDVDPVPPVCSAYVGDEPVCLVCEHDRECHVHQ